MAALLAAGLVPTSAPLATALYVRAFHGLSTKSDPKRERGGPRPGSWPQAATMAKCPRAGSDLPASVNHQAPRASLTEIQLPRACGEGGPRFRPSTPRHHREVPLPLPRLPVRLCPPHGVSPMRTFKAHALSHSGCRAPGKFWTGRLPFSRAGFARPIHAWSSAAGSMAAGTE